MRADERAQSTFDANVRVPNWNLLRNTAFFKFRCRRRKRAVDWQGTDGQQVALARDDHGRDAFDKVGTRFGHWQTAGDRAGCLVGNLDFGECSERTIHGGKVAFQQRWTAFTVGAANHLFDVGDCLVTREDVRECEKAGLHHRVDACTETGLLSHIICVDDKKSQPFVNDLLLRFTGQIVPDLAGVDRAVEQECRSGFGHCAAHPSAGETGTDGRQQNWRG